MEEKFFRFVLEPHDAALREAYGIGLPTSQRQRLAGLKGALLFNEADHLGAYIAKNRFDMDISEQLKEADQVVWDGFSDKVDQHFEGEAWRTTPPPSQPRPAALDSVFETLDRRRPTNWLRLDSMLRSFAHDGRRNIDRYLDHLISTLAEHRFQIGEDIISFMLFGRQ